ncbi:hypothetical protein VMCG_06521 [Cytospora schulzeri]|uniref:Uncharacterized protein n=1 Tax=Cytospora schulzeri TaxID=448051 RepID=A0A423WBN3_9PEZI|nr:hypothetical protein VMCG_06521 [Valsa malicola]
MECVNQATSLAVSQIAATSLHYTAPGFSPSSLGHVWDWTFSKGIAAVDVQVRCPESPSVSPRSGPVQKDNDTIPTLTTWSIGPRDGDSNTAHSSHFKELYNGPTSTPSGTTTQVPRSYVRPQDFLSSNATWLDTIDTHIESSIEDIEKLEDEAASKEHNVKQTRTQLTTAMPVPGPQTLGIRMIKIALQNAGRPV